MVCLLLSIAFGDIIRIFCLLFILSFHKYNDAFFPIKTFVLFVQNKQNFWHFKGICLLTEKNNKTCEIAKLPDYTKQSSV